MDMTPEQLTIIKHQHSEHARVRAGPGTGKSTTIIAFAEKASREKSRGTVRLATFTRAATSELAEKALEGGVSVPVTTVHSLALSILQSNLQWTRLQQPLRIPDQWEFDELIHPDLRDRLAVLQPGIRKQMVKRLEREMAARWEALDEDVTLLSDVDPELRDAYVAAWQRQRAVFGYSLFAEMPWYALEMVQDHPEASVLGLELFIVDEYQDLNRCEISLIGALAGRGVTVIAVGDDDQSIYSWRMAAPQGIRSFPQDFGGQDYSLSVSHRCGRRIIEAAQRVIRTAPGRDPARQSVIPSDNNPDGEFAYLRFPSAQAERTGVVTLLRKFRESGVEYDRMAVLLRADYQGRWSRPLRDTLDEASIPYTDIEAAVAPLNEPASRQLLALSRLALNERDDLSWWTLLHLWRGISEEFIRALADEAFDDTVRFAQRLMQLPERPVEGGSSASDRAARRCLESTQAVLAAISEEPAPESGERWIEWLLGIADRHQIQLSEAFRALLHAVAARGDGDEVSFRSVIEQLEPTAVELALESPGVSIMTISRSKGLTFDTVVTMGVEEELFPSPFSLDPEEDRRLLYVAMTRARLSTILTMAGTRNDGTAHSGTGDAIRSRSRAGFLSQAGIAPAVGSAYLSAINAM